MSGDSGQPGDETPQGQGARPGSAGRATAGRLPAIAALLAAGLLLSRVSGYLRDLALANRLGAGAEVDAFGMAFLLPDLLNYLLAGGALAIAFVPFYTRTLETSGDEAAGRLFATVLGTLGTITVVATGVLWWFAEDLAAGSLTGFDAEGRALTVRLIRIVLPAQIFFVTGGILRAVLMSHGHFRAQAAAGLVYNGCQIIGGLATGSVEGFAWGVVVGAALGNWLAPMLELRRVRAVRVRVAFLDLDFRRYLWIALPLMVGISLSTVDEWYEKYLGHSLAVGSVAVLSYARKLMMAPVTVIGQAIGAATLPVLAQLHTIGDSGRLDSVLLRALQVSLGLGMLGGAAIWALSGPIVELLFHHGRFDADAVARTAGLLAWMSLATPAWVLQQVAVRGFYARAETWRPMLLGTAIALGVIPLYLLLRERFGLEGLAMAGVIAMSLNATATVAWLWLRHGAPPPLALLETLLRSAGIAVPAALMAVWVQPGGVGRAAAALDLVSGGAVFAVLAIGGVFAFGDAATLELARDGAARLAARLRRRG